MRSRKDVPGEYETYDLHTHSLTYLQWRKKTWQEGEDCPSEAACNPQEGASKAKSVRWTRATLRHRDSCMSGTQFQPKIVGHIAGICIVMIPERMRILNMLPKTGTGRTRRSKGRKTKLRIQALFAKYSLVQKSD